MFGLWSISKLQPVSDTTPTMTVMLEGYVRLTLRGCDVRFNILIDFLLKDRICQKTGYGNKSGIQLTPPWKFLPHFAASSANDCISVRAIDVKK